MFAVAIVAIFNPSLLLDSLPCERGFEDRYFVFAIITVYQYRRSIARLYDPQLLDITHIFAVLYVSFLTLQPLINLRSFLHEFLLFL